MIAAHDGIPISAADRVSDVLARDERLVEVFVRHAPHFSKLRNRAMRRVMARLVTVEQAARTAGIAPDQLVNDLNEALGFAVPPVSHSTATAAAASSEAEPTRQHPTSAPVVELDVREDLRSGREPFSRIMSAVGSLGDEDVLHLRATFEPVPLFTVLGKRGFVHESQAHAADDWSVWFWRSGDSEAEREGAAEDQIAVPSDVPQNDEHTTYLDVRGLNPPEPLMRTIAALESLPAGHTLVQINSRVPQFLLPVLVERGFAYVIDESQSDRVLVRMSHA